MPELLLFLKLIQNKTDNQIDPNISTYFDHDFLFFFSLALRLQCVILTGIHNAGHLNEQTFVIVLYRPPR